MWSSLLLLWTSLLCSQAPQIAGLGIAVEGVTWQFALWCIMFGAAGQFIHSLIGLYKLYVDPTRDTKSNLDCRRFFLSIVMGACIGGLCCLIYNDPLSKQDALGVLAFGYAGVDGIEAFMSKRAQIVGDK